MAYFIRLILKLYKNIDVDNFDFCPVFHRDYSRDSFSHFVHINHFVEKCFSTPNERFIALKLWIN